MTTKEQQLTDEIKKKFYKLKSNDKLTLTGKQLKEFAGFNRQEARKELIEDEIEFLNVIKKRFKIVFDIEDFGSESINISNLINKRLKQLGDK